VTGPYPIAVILAGGRGTRLHVLGQVLPKCLLPVFDKPLLVHQIEQCAAAGVGEVVVATSTLFAPSVRAVLDLYTPPPGLRVRCVAESACRGPVAGLLSLAPDLAGAPALVLLGDEYYEDSGPFAALAGRRTVPDLLLGVVEDSPPERILCNVVMAPGGRVLGLREKPALAELVGAVRWCGLAGIGGGWLEGVADEAAGCCVHVGDLLAHLMACGARGEGLVFAEVHLNLNTAEDALAASLVEARRRLDRDPRLSAGCFDGAIAALAGVARNALAAG
jgi:MobA-like NTP transferase domain